MSDEDLFYTPGSIYNREPPKAETPHRCPVCNGRGIVGAGFYQSTSGITTTGGTAPETCRSCWGKGVIWRC